MKVKNLILKLQDMPMDAYIVIDNMVVGNVELEDGRNKEGWLNETWLPLPTGKKEAVRFTRSVELSDGSLTDFKF